VDKSANKRLYSSATFLEHMGVPVWIDARHTIAHNSRRRHRDYRQLQFHPGQSTIASICYLGEHFVT
jgi:hypothetical protein